MNGELHFNEVLYDDVALTDDDVLGEVGNGWHQMTAELGFERSGPERILSTATLLFDVIRTLGRQADPSAPAGAVGDLVARMCSLRQLSISVARALTDGHDAASRAALVKDLGTRFEQDSVEVTADLLDHLDAGSPDAGRLRALLDTARVHSPLFTLRGGTNEVLRGVVAKTVGRDTVRAPTDELSQLDDDVGRRSFESGGHRGLPNVFDAQLWRTLEDTGLSRLTTAEGAGLRESAIVLGGLARWAGAAMAGELERACAASLLATAAAADYGFDSPQADYSITVAKVAVGRAVGPVSTIAHQLHGAIGVNMEHRLWLATMRTRSWADEFGTPGHHARRLGERALAADDPWALVVGP